MLCRPFVDEGGDKKKGKRHEKFEPAFHGDTKIYCLFIRSFFFSVPLFKARVVGFRLHFFLFSSEKHKIIILFISPKTNAFREIHFASGKVEDEHLVMRLICSSRHLCCHAFEAWSMKKIGSNRLLMLIPTFIHFCHVYISPKIKRRIGVCLCLERVVRGRNRRKFFGTFLKCVQWKK